MIGTMTESLADRRVVAIGGGTGLPLVLRALRDIGVADPTAVVTMADDGGSSGRLRRELGILPPGDIRNCLVALADPAEERLAQVFNYRFTDGEGIAGHALGNLILAALADQAGSFEDAVRLAGRHLKIHGQVLPSTYDDVVLHGLDEEGNEISGQASVANNDVAMFRVSMTPANATANPLAVQAILDADTVLIGPGSLYTSLIPNVLIPGVLEALRETKAHVVYLCNVANGRGETTGFDSYDHVAALYRHGLKGLIDTVVVARGPLCPDDCRAESIAELGVAVHLADLANPENPLRHDPTSLREVLGAILAPVGVA